MNYWKILVIFLFILSFLFYFTERNDLTGSDNYNSYFKSCGIKLGEYPLISEYIYSSLPCDINYFKLFAFFLAFCYGVSLYFFVKHYYPSDVWKVLFLFTLGIGFHSWFFEIEDDNIAYPLLNISLLLFLKGQESKNNTLKVASIVFTCLVGLFIWKGALIYLFSFAFFSPLALGIFILIVLYFGLYRIFGSLFPALDPLSKLLWENTFALGFSAIPFFLPSFVNAGNRKYLYWFFAIFVLLMLFSSRLVFLLIPLLLVLMMDFLIWLKSKVLFYFPLNPDLKILKFTMAVCLSYLFLSNTVFLLDNSEPSPELWKMINDGKKIANDYNLPFKNEWSFGYFMLYKGVDTNVYGGWRPNVDLNHSIAISSTYDLQCTLIKETKTPAFSNGLYLYHCP